MELFGTAGIRGPVTRVTPELALAVGRAVGVDAAADEAPVVLARDGRDTGESLASAAEAGLTSAGADVQRVGQLPTPALAFASRDRYGIMLTASHNPPEHNGIKLFADGREFTQSAEQRIEERVRNDIDPTSWDGWGTIDRTSVLADYRGAVLAYAEKIGDSPDATVAVDCGNGMASLAGPQVLTALGADVVALNANVDGRFTARESKPTAESLEGLRNFVADGPAAFGIGHDGDADRIVIVDGTGAVVHEDTILAILAERFIRRSESPDPVVVTTPNASSRIDDRVRAAGGRVERVRLGALHEGISAVHENGTEGTDVVFAAEPWKHVHPAFGEWIDGIASAAVLTRLFAADGLESLREPVPERPYRKISVDCPDDRKVAAMQELHSTLPDTFPEASVDTEYGVRLEFPDGSWTLVRPSGTEPYIRFYAESEDVEALAETVRECIEAAIEG
jgi:phosphomannomutase